MSTLKKRSIAVLGAGSWGTALALVLARNGHSTCLWGHRASHVEQMIELRCNGRYLPDIAFPDSLEVSADLGVAVAQRDMVLLVVPGPAMADTLAKLRPLVSSDVDIVWGTKGVDPATSGLMSDVVAASFSPHTPMAVVSGPTFALEVARQLPCALTCAANDVIVADRIANDFRCEYMRVYTSDDMTGVQLGGVIKNVIAIAAGICDGLSLGANARAALITRGLSELARLGVAMGGRAETLAGLSGVGDLILTCTDDQSRNRRLGLALAAGVSLEDAVAALGQEAEGVNTTRVLFAKCQALKLEMPITQAVHAVLFEQLAATDAVRQLLARHPGSE